jgi:hypothetical protein
MRGLLPGVTAATLLLPASSATGRFVTVRRAALQVTEGRLAPGPRLRVEDAKFRAVASGADGTGAELRFRYLGPTRRAAALRSGEMREQLGLKLLAADGCNVLYVMWRLAPRPGLVVSVKHNPGQHRSRECGNRGYRNLRPLRAAAVAPLRPGAAHVLSAVLRGERLEVRVDGSIAWEGLLPPEALELRGPPGLRSDNVCFEFELAVPPGGADAPEAASRAHIEGRGGAHAAGEGR